MFDKYFTYKEFNLYLTECFATFLKLKDGDELKVIEKIPIRLIDANPDTIYYSKYVKGEDNNLHGKQESGDILWKNKEKYIDFTYLPKGAINMASSVIYLRNISKVESPWKYKKLPNAHDTKIYDPFKKERILLRSPSPSQIDDWFILNSWVNNKYVSAQEAFENVLSFKRLSQAWSNQWYVGLKHECNSFVVFKRGLIIGKVNADNGEIRLKPRAHCLEQELNEYGLTVRKMKT